MNRRTAITIALGAFALAAFAVAVPITADAQTPPDAGAAAGARAEGLRERLRDRPKPSAIAIAFGNIEGDEAAVIDFRAAQGAERGLGNLRFWAEDDGFYNGAVRTLRIAGQQVHAEGAGPLRQPDGTRVPVRFTLDLNADTRHVTITVTGRDLNYTLEGTIEGFVFVGAPPQPAN